MAKFKFLRKRSDYYRHFTVLDIGTDLIKVLVVRRDGPDGGGGGGVGGAAAPRSLAVRVLPLRGVDAGGRVRCDAGPPARPPGGQPRPSDPPPRTDCPSG